MKTKQIFFLVWLFPHMAVSQMGQVLSFDGFDDRVEANQDYGLSDIANLTVEVWVRIEEYDNIHVVYRGTNNFIVETFKIGIKDGEAELRFQGGVSSLFILKATTIFNLDEWYHIAATYDGIEAKIYINGVLENSAIWNTNILGSPGGQLIIGIDRDGFNDYNQEFKGCMDEVRIWNVARTQEEIQMNMNIPLNGNEQGLVGYYDMEQSGDELLDVSGNLINGILMGNLGINNTPVFSNAEVDLDLPQSDYTICEGSTLSFDVSGANEYIWWPAQFLDDPSIANPTAILFESTQFWVTGSSSCGAFSDTVSVFVEVENSSSEELTIEVCPDQTTFYYGVELAIGDSQDFVFENMFGCDSFLTVTIIEGGEFEMIEEAFVCAGDSILIHGNYENSPGVYTQIFSGVDCDTLFSVVLDWINPISAEIENNPSCIDSLTGSATVYITGGIAPYQIYWEDFPDSSETTISGLAPGVYGLQIVDDFGCETIESITILSLDEFVVPLVIDHVSCWGYYDASVTIDSSANDLVFSLDNINFSNTGVYQNLSPGHHTLYFQNAEGCQSSQNFFISEPDLLVLALPEDTVIQLGCGFKINSFYSGTTDSIQASWSPDEIIDCGDCLDRIVYPIETTEYTLTITDQKGCSAQDSMLIDVESERSLYIPNVFSPNGDGINDDFCIYPGKGVDRILLFRIYNRWGAQLFEAKDFKAGDGPFCWNGYFRNELMNTDVYAYYAKVLFLDGVKMDYKGDVTLLK